MLCCVSLFSAYPVIGCSDMLNLLGKGNYQNYDAHVVPVVPKDAANPHELNYYPCEPQALQHPFAGGHASQQMRTQHKSTDHRLQTAYLNASTGFTYLELVLFESAQVVPRFVVRLVRSCIPRPLLPGPGVPREIDLRYCRMLLGHAIDCGASEQLLQALLQQPALIAFIKAAEAASKERRRLHKADKLAARATSHFKSASTVVMGHKIGSGTFGSVFQAKWQGFDVAVKQLNKVDASAGAALHKEAMIMMGVSSPHIVRVFGLVDQPLGIIMVRQTTARVVESCNPVERRSLCHLGLCTTACALPTRPSLLCKSYTSCVASPTACSPSTMPASFT